MTGKKLNSRIEGFYKLSLEEKIDLLTSRLKLSQEDQKIIQGEEGLDPKIAQNMIENVVGQFSLPLGLALNFRINGRDVLVPMAIEEPSVVAGASFMAKIARESGGFSASSSKPVMIGQLQLLDVENLSQTRDLILKNKDQLLLGIADVDPILTKLGGGPLDLEVREILNSAIGSFLVIHLLIDVRDAMGANVVNTACERLAPELEALTGARVHLRILSNLADKRLAKATCKISPQSLAFDQYSGEEVRDGIIEAWAFGDADPYRGATHNKGIMNGIDAVVLATGNDWRAVEAGAHAYAARHGFYRSLSTWSSDQDGNLCGELELPLAVGIVGGATKVHPGAEVVLKIMGVKTAGELAEIIVSVGLAQNLAALRALATDGIQKGHMQLHARQVAIAAGAEGDQIPRLADQLRTEDQIRIDRAQEILAEWKNQSSDKADL
jgi:hydroxymethylglutaryl-CoA reductase